MHPRTQCHVVKSGRKEAEWVQKRALRSYRSVAPIGICAFHARDVDVQPTIRPTQPQQSTSTAPTSEPLCSPCCSCCLLRRPGHGDVGRPCIHRSIHPQYYLMPPPHLFHSLPSQRCLQRRDPIQSKCPSAPDS